MEQKLFVRLDAKCSEALSYIQGNAAPIELNKNDAIRYALLAYEQELRAKKDANKEAQA